MQSVNSLSVKQLNFYVRSLIEGDTILNNVTVLGEISNFKNHYQSGHLYFTLKDSDAAVRCVMFKAYAQQIKFKPSDGMKVLLKGRVSLYEKDGQYQFYAEEMLEDGIGDITRKFNEIKDKLSKEGLFDTSSKRPMETMEKPTNFGEVQGNKVVNTMKVGLNKLNEAVKILGNQSNSALVNLKTLYNHLFQPYIKSIK